MLELHWEQKKTSNGIEKPVHKIRKGSVHPHILKFLGTPILS